MLQILKEARKEVAEEKHKNSPSTTELPPRPEMRRIVAGLAVGVTALAASALLQSEMPAVSEALLEFGTLSHLYAGWYIAKIAMPNLVKVPEPVSNFLSNRKEDAFDFSRRARLVTGNSARAGFRAITSFALH